MQFLISTLSNDLHAAAVGAVLCDRGHQVHLHYGEDFPGSQPISMMLGGTDSNTFELRSDAVDLQHFDVVWNRRRMRFQIPESVHPDDRDYVRKEARAFSDCLWDSVAPTAFWVNPIAVAERARRKLAQLRAARDCGFVVPETLMSNDPEQIRAFVRSHPAVVFKTFMPAFWDSGQQFRSLFATRVRLDQIDSTIAIQNCPGIYQALIPAAFELRITAIGQNLFAMQHHAAGSSSSVDSRASHLDGSMQTAVYDVPSGLRERILAFMANLGLRFACFDILMLADGRFCFLEANEAGQFLWIEQLQPTLPVLDAFCSFLVATDDRFQYRPSAPDYRLHQVQQLPVCQSMFQRQSAVNGTASTPLFVAT